MNILRLAARVCAKLAAVFEECLLIPWRRKRHPMGESNSTTVRLQFDRWVHLEFHGATNTAERVHMVDKCIEHNVYCGSH